MTRSVASTAAPAALGDGDERQVPVVVHARELRQHAGRQLAHSIEETEVARFIGKVAHEFLLDSLVFRAYGTQRDGTAVAERHPLDQLGGVGLHDRSIIHK